MIVLALALAGAVPAPPPTAADAATIRAKCHVPRSWVRYRNGALHMSPPKDAPERKIECILAEATKNFPKRGFIGNEAYKP